MDFVWTGTFAYVLCAISFYVISIHFKIIDAALTTYKMDQVKQLDSKIDNGYLLIDIATHVNQVGTQSQENNRRLPFMSNARILKRKLLSLSGYKKSTKEANHVMKYSNDRKNTTNYPISTSPSALSLNHFSSNRKSTNYLNTTYFLSTAYSKATYNSSLVNTPKDTNTLQKDPPDPQNERLAPQRDTLKLHNAQNSRDLINLQGAHTSQDTTTYQDIHPYQGTHTSQETFSHAYTPTHQDTPSTQEITNSQSIIITHKAANETTTQLATTKSSIETTSGSEQMADKTKRKRDQTSSCPQQLDAMLTNFGKYGMIALASSLGLVSLLAFYLLVCVCLPHCTKKKKREKKNITENISDMRTPAAVIYRPRPSLPLSTKCVPTPLAMVMHEEQTLTSTPSSSRNDSPPSDEKVVLVTDLDDTLEQLGPGNGMDEQYGDRKFSNIDPSNVSTFLLRQNSLQQDGIRKNSLFH